MKVVINKCFGGFSLSVKAIKRLAELHGRECHFFKRDEESYIRITEEDAEKGFFIHAMDVPECPGYTDWYDKSIEERQAINQYLHDHMLEVSPVDRSDPLLIQVVEELGKNAWGSCANLEIIDIPDGVKWEIKEYDGFEHVAEVHRTWG